MSDLQRMEAGPDPCLRSLNTMEVTEVDTQVAEEEEEGLVLLITSEKTTTD